MAEKCRALPIALHFFIAKPNANGEQKMNRRNFGKWLAMAFASANTYAHASRVDNSGQGAGRAQSASSSSRSRHLIKPAMLKQGDLVGLIAPGGVMDDALTEKGVRNLESYGFKVKSAPTFALHAAAMRVRSDSASMTCTLCFSTRM